jgi:hypothetical protein
MRPASSIQKADGTFRTLYKVATDRSGSSSVQWDAFAAWIHGSTTARPPASAAIVTTSNPDKEFSW